MARRGLGTFLLAAERPHPIADDLLARLPGSPDIYPQKIDLVLESILLVRFDEAAYRAASFLDDRILRPARVVVAQPE